MPSAAEAPLGQAAGPVLNKALFKIHQIPGSRENLCAATKLCGSCVSEGFL